jgi:hypothetical protein
MVPQTRYAKSGDVHIAFQVAGGGPFDLVFVPGFISNLDLMWENPAAARSYRRVGRSQRCRELTRARQNDCHSIVSSARRSTVEGTSRPSVFAVLRLMNSSDLIDC